jgi:hypothetical protein
MKRFFYFLFVLFFGLTVYGQAPTKLDIVEIGVKIIFPDDSEQTSSTNINAQFLNGFSYEDLSGQIRSNGLSNIVFSAVNASSNYISTVSNYLGTSYIEYCATNGTTIGGSTQYVYRTVDSSTNFISWVSNSVENSVAFFNYCYTNIVISDGSITGSKLVNNTLTSSQIGPNAITDSELADGALSVSKLAGELLSGDVTNSGNSLLVLKLRNTPVPTTSGQNGKLLALNSAGTAFEFVTASSGDMLKSVYDTDLNNEVDISYLSRTSTNATGMVGYRISTSGLTDQAIPVFDSSSNGFYFITLAGLGGGDMLKSTFAPSDILNEGIVDRARTSTYALAASTAANATGLVGKLVTTNGFHLDEVVATYDQDSNTILWRSLAALGGGDMLKSEYDINANGIVDVSQTSLVANVAQSLYANVVRSSNVVDGTLNKVDMDSSILDEDTSFGGDIDDTYNAITVVGLQGRGLDASTPTHGQGFFYDTNTGTYVLSAPSSSSGGGSTQYVYRIVDSSTNYIAWISNSVDNGIVYFDYCLTNGGSGGLTHWSEGTGTATQAGTWFASTNVAAIPYGSSTPARIGPFISTNRSFSLRGPPNGLANTTNSSGTGNALGAGAVDLQMFWATSSSSDNLATEVASGIGAFIGAGVDNRASGNFSGVIAGYANRATGANSITAGSGNTVASSDSVVFGQGNNLAVGAQSGILSGVFNAMSGAANKDYSVIAGGYGNALVAGNYAFMGAGYDNKIGSSGASRSFGTIIQGQSGRLDTTLYGSILNGFRNTIATSTNVAILIGYGNSINGATNAIILQGSSQTLTNSNEALIGNNLRVLGTIYAGALSADSISLDAGDLTEINLMEVETITAIGNHIQVEKDIKMGNTNILIGTNGNITISGKIISGALPILSSIGFSGSSGFTLSTSFNSLTNSGNVEVLTTTVTNNLLNSISSIPSSGYYKLSVNLSFTAGAIIGADVITSGFSSNGTVITYGKISEEVESISDTGHISAHSIGYYTNSTLIGFMLKSINSTTITINDYLFSIEKIE